MFDSFFVKWTLNPLDSFRFSRENANDSADDESELHGPRHLPRVGRDRSWGRLPERPIEVGHARRFGRAAAAVARSGGQRHGSVCRQWRRSVSRSVDRKPDRTTV